VSNDGQPSYDDLLRQAQRDQIVKENLAQRIGQLMRENLELLATLAELQGQLPAVGSNGAAVHVEETSS
jgi:hypothetical protein